MAPDHAAFPGKAIHVALAADADFVMPLAVALNSLALAHSPDELQVTVMHDGISNSDMARVERGPAAQISVDWQLVDTAELSGAHHTGTLSRATLFRLLLPVILPASIERTIYLDCDVVVAGSLRPLSEIDLGDDLLGAVRDAGAPFPASPYGTDWRGLGLAPGAPLFNAGVLAIPLEAWRQADISGQALDVLRHSKPRWGDQDALNVALEGRWVELDRRWNLQTPDAVGNGLAWALWTDAVAAALADPAVIHYTERDKPWHPDSRHPFAQRWYEALDETDWAGWRPRRSSLPRRVAGRAKRAGRLLVADRSRAAT